MRCKLWPTFWDVILFWGLVDRLLKKSRVSIRNSLFVTEQCHCAVSRSFSFSGICSSAGSSCIYARRSQIYTMSRQKRVNRWGSVWCLSLQIMNSCVFTSYHFPRSGDERAKPAVYQGTHTLATAITLVEICPMSLFSVVWGSIDSRWRKLDGVIQHTSHIIFFCLYPLLFFTWWIDYISKNRLL